MLAWDKDFSLFCFSVCSEMLINKEWKPRHPGYDFLKYIEEEEEKKLEAGQFITSMKCTEWGMYRVGSVLNWQCTELGVY